jgi:hypothetical protein
MTLSHLLFMQRSFYFTPVFKVFVSNICAGFFTNIEHLGELLTLHNKNGTFFIPVVSKNVF